MAGSFELHGPQTNRCRADCDRIQNISRKFWGLQGYSVQLEWWRIDKNRKQSVGVGYIKMVINVRHCVEFSTIIIGVNSCKFHPNSRPPPIFFQITGEVWGSAKFSFNMAHTHNITHDIKISLLRVGRYSVVRSVLGNSWTVWRSNTGGGRDFRHPSTPDLLPLQPPMQWVPGYSWG